MSVELRWHITGECDHGVKPIGAPRSECEHDLECDWGTIEHPDPCPDRNQVGHLMLAVGWCVGARLGKGPIYDRKYGFTTVYAQDDRLFIRTEHDNGSWTWELFPAHFADGEGTEDMYIGRWPD